MLSMQSLAQAFVNVLLSNFRPAQAATNKRLTMHFMSESMGKSSCLGLYCLEVVSSTRRSLVVTAHRILIMISYVVYVALICVSLVLVYLFFSETR